MKLRNFGSAAHMVPVIGQGTWNLPERGKATPWSVFLKSHGKQRLTSSRGKSGAGEGW